MPDQDSSTPEKGRYTVWFGTNRDPVYERGSLTGFSSERSETVHYGSCRVAIPESHTIGSIGSSWWKRLITRTDDRLKLLTLTTLPDGAYWAAVAAELRARRSDERDAVVFLHGYNVSFQDAAFRAAQVGFDLGVSGVMAFYSWPSKGTLQGYPADEATIEASEGFIADFLTSMAGRSGARRVHIIAHSMGNRGLLRAIDRIATAAAERTRTPFDQIILAAADVDQDTFKRLSAAYQRVARRTTMYVCSKDRAVEASHWLHDFPRAGLAPPVLVVPGIDTINVSNLDLTLLGHGYVAEARELLTDIHALLRDGSPPAQRFGLRKVTSPAGEYWVVGR
jgi:esterase/lipase superfamily enzyme